MMARTGVTHCALRLLILLTLLLVVAARITTDVRKTNGPFTKNNVTDAQKTDRIAGGKVADGDDDVGVRKNDSRFRKTDETVLPRKHDFRVWETGLLKNITDARDSAHRTVASEINVTAVTRTAAALKTAGNVTVGVRTTLDGVRSKIAVSSPRSTDNPRAKNVTFVGGGWSATGREFGAVSLVGHSDEEAEVLGPAVTAAGGQRDARRTEQRGHRCAALPLMVGNDDNGDYDDSTLEGTRTVDRYRVQPMVAAFYRNPIVYRRARPAAVYRVLRRRPVVVVDGRPEQRPTSAAQLYYEFGAADAAPAARAPQTGVGLPYVQNVLAVNGRERSAGDVSWTADDVRRILRRVFTEGVLAGQADARP